MTTLQHTRTIALQPVNLPNRATHVTPAWPTACSRNGRVHSSLVVQNVINQFTQLAQDGRVGFLGNVRVGKDLSLEELRARYNAVVLCYGAESDRPLGVPGEVGMFRCTVCATGGGLVGGWVRCVSL